MARRAPGGPARGPISRRARGGASEPDARSPGAGRRLAGRRRRSGVRALRRVLRRPPLAEPRGVRPLATRCGEERPGADAQRAGRGTGLRVPHGASGELGTGGTAARDPGPAGPRGDGAGRGPRRRRVARPPRLPGAAVRAPDEPDGRRRAGRGVAPGGGRRVSARPRTGWARGRDGAVLRRARDVPAGAVPDGGRRRRAGGPGLLRARGGRALSSSRRAGAPGVARRRGGGARRSGRDFGALRPYALGPVVQLLRRLGGRVVTGALAPRVSPVAITGAGVVTAIGQDLDGFWAGLVTGVSGISEIEGFPVGDLRVTRAGEVKKLRRDIPVAPRGGDERPRRASYCRTSRFLVHAAREALETSELRDALPAAERIGVVVGTALGGIDEASRALAAPGAFRALTGSVYDGPTRNLARWLGARGPVLTVTTACASGATSLGLAADLLRAGQVDVVLAGGADGLCRFVQRGFNVLRSLTRDAVRPFDRRRSGLLLGEGAGLVVLERVDTAVRRGHRPLGYLLGHASTADGAHITAPDPEGRGLELAVRAALAEAGLAPAALDFVSAHGTGTSANDRVETDVLKRVLGPRARAIPVNSIKAHLGHTMGAAATLEAIMCLLAGRHGQVPPTLNYGEADPECDLDCVPNAARMWRPRVSLSTSLGFGGCNAALVLATGEEP